jgi:EF hand
MLVKTTFTIALAVASLMACPVIAQTNFFTHFDRDKNGRVTAGEISHQRDAEIIAAMDSNKDGVVTPEEWQTTGRGASFIEKGGVTDRGITQRWIEFNIVYFSFDKEVISTNWTQGQAPLALNASAQDVEALRQALDTRYLTQPDSFARAVGQVAAPD